MYSLNTQLWIQILKVNRLLLVKPDNPRILQPVPINSTINGINDFSLNLVCLSTGGYPQQTLEWFLIPHGQTPTRLTRCNTTSSYANVSDLYNVTSTCTFTPTFSDDGVTFRCQSSFSGEPQMEDLTDVQFEIACKYQNWRSVLVITKQKRHDLYSKILLENLWSPA